MRRVDDLYQSLLKSLELQSPNRMWHKWSDMLLKKTIKYITVTVENKSLGKAISFNVAFFDNPKLSMEKVLVSIAESKNCQL